MIIRQFIFRDLKAWTDCPDVMDSPVSKVKRATLVLVVLLVTLSTVYPECPVCPDSKVTRDVTEFLEPPADRVSTEKRATPASVSRVVPVAKAIKEIAVSTDWMVRPDFVVHLAHLVILDNKVTMVSLDPLVRLVLR